MASGHGPWLVSATALFLGWTTLIVVTRTWAKLRTKSWGYDDFAILLAFAFNITHVALICSAVHQGYGHHIDNIADVELGRVERVLYVGRIFYVACVGFCKISTALFITNLSASAPQVRPAYILAVVSALWTVISSFILAIHPNTNQPWEIVEGTGSLFHRWLGIEISGLIIELLLWLLSFSIVWNLHMRWLRRTVILSAFGVRLLLIPIVVIRLTHLSPKDNQDWTLDTVIPGIVTEVVLHFSVISACTTSLRPFLRALRLEYAPSAIHLSGPTLGSNTYRSSMNRSKNKSILRSAERTSVKDPYYRLDTIQGNHSADDTRQQDKQHSHWAAEPHDVVYPAPTHLRSGNRQEGKSAGAMENSAIGSNSSKDTATNKSPVENDQIVIHLTTGWSIQYEDKSKE